jgi:DNA (cytosine-5)-methyltransferase 1
VRAASCFSGIGAAELALPEAQWLWSAEVDPFANAVRAARLDDNCLGSVLEEDFLQRAAAYGDLDLLIGGPPCQDFSVAGLRQGLDGARGNLTLRWVQIIHALRPVWTITENVPGWLSVNGGRAFGAFIAGLVGHDTAILPPKGAGGRWTDAGMVDGPEGRLCWRTLDAQFFGLAQRRRRVFVVFCPRGGRDPSQVLFEPASLRGDTAPSRETREGVAATLTQGAESSGRGGYAGRRREDDVNLVAHTLRVPSHDAAWRGDGCDNLVAGTLSWGALGGRNADTADILAYGGNRQSGPIDVATAVNAHGGPHGRLDFESETFVTHALDSFSAGRMTEDGTGRGCPIVAHSLRADGFDASEGGTGRGAPLVAAAFDARQSDVIQYGDMAGPLDTDGHSVAVAFNNTGQGWWNSSDTASPIRNMDAGSGSKEATLVGTSAVRRLTPVECERLQGFPDGWTDVAYRGKPAADGPRYRALGNAFAVPVIAWIARRIVREHEAALPVAVAA